MVLNGVPRNRTRDTENAGFILEDSPGFYTASPPAAIRTNTVGNEGEARILVPNSSVAVYHDHFRGTTPGPGARDASAIYNGKVNYIKDVNGYIYKIEYSSTWKASNNGNGWRLTTLQGQDLQGQSTWVPGYVSGGYK